MVAPVTTTDDLAMMRIVKRLLSKGYSVEQIAQYAASCAEYFVRAAERFPERIDLEPIRQMQHAGDD